MYLGYKAKTAKILFSPDGAMRFIWDDEIAELAREVGEIKNVSRASHVEPTSDGRWTVDLQPVGGPPCLSRYDTRGEALRAEHEWLEAHSIPVPR